MELRQRLDEVFDRLDVECGRGGWNALADAILAIPEIRDALNGVRPVGGYWERTGTGKGARKWVPVP